MSRPLELLADLANQMLGRATAKALPDGKKEEAAVPLPPEETRTDPRAEGASPTEEDLENAKKEGEEDGAGGEGGDQDGFDQNGHRDLNPDDLGQGGEDEEEEEPAGDGRPASKAFTDIPGHVIPTDDLLLHLDEGHGGFEALFGQFLAAIGDQTSVLKQLLKDVEELKKGVNVNHEAMSREVKKALDGTAAVEARLENLHVTAPAAQPRAAQKALTDAPAPGGQPSLTVGEIQQLVANGKINSLDAARLCQQAQNYL